MMACKLWVVLAAATTAMAATIVPCRSQSEVPQPFDGAKFERDLAKRFLPIVLTDEPDCYLPVTLRRVFENVWLSKPLAGSPPERISFTNLVNYAMEHSTERCAFWPTAFNLEKDKLSWPYEPDIFYRVQGLTEDMHPENLPWVVPDGWRTYSLQYYWFMSFSDSAMKLGDVADAGDHDGDWICVDLTVVITGALDGKDANAAADAEVHSVIFHNHGAQLIARPSACEFDGSRLKVYLENNSNEPWPRADGGMIRNDANFEKHNLKENHEWGVRPHRGGGLQVYGWALHDLNAEKPTDEAMLVLKYEGRWGKRAGLGSDVPRGPRQQDKMWRRDFSLRKNQDGPKDPLDLNPRRDH